MLLLFNFKTKAFKRRIEITEHFTILLELFNVFCLSLDPPHTVAIRAYKKFCILFSDFKHFLIYICTFFNGLLCSIRQMHHRLFSHNPAVLIKLFLLLAPIASKANIFLYFTVCYCRILLFP